MRTLDKFPMQYSHSDIHSRLSAHRAKQAQQKLHAQRAAHASANLRNYGKQLFNDTLSKNGSLSSCGSDSSLSRNSSSSLPNIAFTDKKVEPAYSQCTHTGPSRHGSVLYNRKSSLLNSIRLRANSEPPAMTPGRAQSTGQIAVTLKNSNVVYRVVSNGRSLCSRGSVYSCPPVAYTEFALVPAGQEVIHETPEPKQTPNEPIKPVQKPQVVITEPVTIISEHSEENVELNGEEGNLAEHKRTESGTKESHTPVVNHQTVVDVPSQTEGKADSQKQQASEHSAQSSTSSKQSNPSR